MDIAGLTLSVVGASVLVADVRKGFLKVLDTISHWYNYPQDVEKFKGTMAAAQKAFERWDKSIKFVYQNGGDTRGTDERSIATAAEIILIKISEELNEATKILEQHVADHPASTLEHPHDLEAGTAPSPVLQRSTHAPSTTGTRKTWTFAHRGQLEGIAATVMSQMQHLTRLSPEAYEYSRKFLVPEDRKAGANEIEEAQADDSTEGVQQPGWLEDPTTSADAAPNDARRNHFAGDTYEDIEEGEKSTSNYGTFVDGDYRGSLQLGSGSSFKAVKTGKKSTSHFGITFGGKSPFQMALEAKRQKSSSPE